MHGGPFPQGPPFMHRGPLGPNPGHSPGPAEVSKLIFELADLNHDGSLSREEFQRLADAVQRTHHGAPQHGPTPGAPSRAPGQTNSPPFRRVSPPMLHRDGPGGEASRPEMDRPPGGPRPPIQERLQQQRVPQPGGRPPGQAANRNEESDTPEFGVDVSMINVI